MRRRRLLATLAALTVGAASSARPQARPRGDGGLVALAWGAGELHAAHAGGHVQRVSDTVDTRVPACPAGGTALAFVRADGRIEVATVDGDRWGPRHVIDAGDPCHALASSPDGTWLLAAHGEGLTLLDTRSGSVARRHRGEDRLGRRTGPATALATLPHRRSLLAAWPALGEWWEISLDPDAPPVFDGLVHDYRMGEAIARPGYLGVRRVPFDVAAPVPLGPDPRVAWVAAHDGERLVIVHLDVRRTIAVWPLPGPPPEATLLRGEPGAWRWWFARGDTVHVVDATRWPSDLAPARLVAPPGRVRALVEWPTGPGALVGQRIAGREVLQPMRWATAGGSMPGHGSWQPSAPALDAGDGEVVVVAAGGTSGQVLVGGGGALRLLGAQGAVVEAWRLDMAGALAGVAFAQSG